MEETRKQIARSAGQVSLAVMASRILGLVREQVLAGLFGAGTAMDAYVVAYRIPNLLRDLFAEGALSSAFVSVFSAQDQKHGTQKTYQLANAVLGAMSLVVLIIVFAGIVFSEDLVRLMAPDFSAVPGKIALTTLLTRIMFPFLWLVSVAAIFMGILNTKGVFFVPSLSSAFFNAGSITVGVVLAIGLQHLGYPAIVGMAIGVLAGGGLQAAVQLRPLRRLGYRPRPVIDFKDPGVREVFRLMVPAVVGLSATQVNIFVNTYFAASCGEGAVAWLNYAFRLMYLPIGLFGVAISLATLPVASRLAARGSLSELGKTFSQSVGLTLSLCLPAAVGLIVLGEPIVRIIFEHGRFSPNDTLMTATALSFYALGLLGYSGVKVVVPIFYALGRPRWPVVASFASVGLNIAFIVAFIEPLGFRAIALATALTISFNFLFLSAVLYRLIGGFPLSEIVVSSLKVLLASMVMALVCLLCRPYISGPLALQVMVALGIIFLAALVYFVLLLALRSSEASLLKSLVLHVLQSIRPRADK
ncbi:murein biosynthesis integral membrane protein MurJ [Thermosulfuriphilus sp.]